MGRFIAVLFTVASMYTGAFAADTFEDPATKVSFPTKVTVKNSTLDATGVATRSKFFIKIYSIAHYMQNPVKGSKKDVFDEIFKDGKAKQLTTKWVHEASLQQVQEGFLESFKKALPKQDAAFIQSEIGQYVSLYDNGVKPGDVHNVRWLPGGVVELEINGTVKGTVTSIDFAKGLWGIFLGPKSVVDRNNLVKFIVTE